MLKIGEFSQLGQVSVRMLRHYEKMGLLRPAYTDDYSSYRYYSAEQISHIHHVLALKDMGFSLAEITHITCGGLTSEQVLGMLRLRRAELRRQAAGGTAAAGGGRNCGGRRRRPKRGCNGSRGASRISSGARRCQPRRSS